VKALLIAATLHNLGHVRLSAVVANGGKSARARARLARCVLDHVGATDVPVGIGSDGSPTCAQPHEYALAGYAATPDAALREGGALLVETLTRAADKSVASSSFRRCATLPTCARRGPNSCCARYRPSRCRAASSPTRRRPRAGRRTRR
jgi:hypothetical protein